MRQALRKPAPGSRSRVALTSFSLLLGAASCLITASAPTAAASAPTALTVARVPIPTTTSMTASVSAGATVTLTATVAAADGTAPAGWVLFEAGGAVIGSPVVVAGGSASTAATLVPTARLLPLAALFSPASPAYLDSSGSYTEPATSGGALLPRTVSVPPSGAFTVTIHPGTVPMTVSGSVATGVLQDITVTDTRTSDPGWQISGQVSAFTGSGTAAGWTIPGSQLGWTPIVIGTLKGSVVLGGTVAPAKPGLGVATAAATLAEAPRGCGSGTNVLSANLTLAIPLGTVPGPYEGAMTITYVDAGPQAKSANQSQ
ncbi:MAG TPA: Ig-like domain-containing protein [Streptosporangiaceae bacterium]|nr:Ig-like domain-containing protein [Streptosporangiaceae bacterium]